MHLRSLDEALEVETHYLPKLKDNTNWWDKVEELIAYIMAIPTNSIGYDLAIEEPIYSWGRKNPRAFAKQNMLIGAILSQYAGCFAHTYMVNPKAMKFCFTGNGKASKQDVITQAKTLYPSLGEIKNRKSREAIADAIGIGHTAWEYVMGEISKGVTLLGEG